MEKKKVLIFNGSPRKNGETAFMIKTLQEELGEGYECKTVNAYKAGYSAMCGLQMVFYTSGMCHKR